MLNRFCLVVACALFGMLGCSNSSGPDLGYVEGVVTLDGKPLDGAAIQFEPAGGRASSAITDAQGHYVLDFSATSQGALIGKHVVRIQSARTASGGEGDAPLVKARPEILPAKYHARSELTAEVEGGSNTIDFDLTSKS